MPKVERKYLAHFINAAKTGAAVYERLGKDLEEYIVELSAQVDTKKNILGETSVLLSSYEKQGSVEPYYAESGTALFTRLQNIVDNDYVLDDCNTDIIEVKLWETPTAGAYPAIKETAVIEVVSYGGDNTGYQIPFNVHYTGIKTAGTFNPTTKVFTATSNPTQLVTFHVVDSVTTTTNIAGASIVVNGSTIVTDANGIASIDLADATYSYNAIKDGYTTGTDSITVSGASLFETVALVEAA